MTEQLYFDDSYLRTFTARVVRRATRVGLPAVALDRSAFYPEGGGQPGDRGTLNGIPVLDTQQDGDLVWHMLGAELVAEEVTGEIDWTRRFDFMQQHHGQHLLSAAFERLFDATTVSVHLGEETCTVDLAGAALTPDHLAQAEDQTNRVIWDNLRVEARFVDASVLASLDLRKQPSGHARVCIVSAGDFDHSPCGGTHPRRTGEVGAVVLRRWERRGETLRIEFVCGGRAVRDYRWKNSLLNGVAAGLSIGIAELPAAVQRIRAAEERSRRALAVAEERLLHYEAAELLASAERVEGTPVVAQQFEQRELDSLRRLSRLIAEGGGIALLGLHGAKAQLIFARAAGLPYDMDQILREAAALIGGRGGGQPEAAEGGGPNVGRLGEALEEARLRVMARGGDRV